jgi:hypothetical protein
MHLHGILGCMAKLVPVKLSGSGIIFLLGIGGVAIMLPEKLSLHREMRIWSI